MIPSSNLRQAKLEQQRQLIEQKQKHKRQQQVIKNIFLMKEFVNQNVKAKIMFTLKYIFQGKMIQASDLKSGVAKTRGRPLSARRELHGYDGPLQFLSQTGNPDEMTTVQVSAGLKSKNFAPGSVGSFFCCLGWVRSGKFL